MSIQVYQIEHDNKLINCVDYTVYNQLVEKYNDLASKYNSVEKDLTLSLEAKDQKEALLREYENKMGEMNQEKRQLLIKIDNLELSNKESNDAETKYTAQMAKIKKDKKEIEKQYDQLEEKFIRTEMELKDMKNTLKGFKELFSKL